MVEKSPDSPWVLLMCIWRHQDPVIFEWLAPMFPHWAAKHVHITHTYCSICLIVKRAPKHQHSGIKFIGNYSRFVIPTADQTEPTGSQTKIHGGHYHYLLVVDFHKNQGDTTTNHQQPGGREGGSFWVIISFLKWKHNVTNILKISHQRPFFVKQLRKVGVSKSAIIQF